MKLVKTRWCIYVPIDVKLLIGSLRQNAELHYFRSAMQSPPSDLHPHERGWQSVTTHPYLRVEQLTWSLWASQIAKTLHISPRTLNLIENQNIASAGFNATGSKGLQESLDNPLWLDMHICTYTLDTWIQEDYGYDPSVCWALWRDFNSWGLQPNACRWL